MSRRKRQLYLAAFVFHFALIASISCRDTFWLVQRGLTNLPPGLERPAALGEWLAETALGEPLGRANPIRRLLRGYLHLSGAEAGYGFFAPNVPDSYQLVFELHYPDERVEYVTTGDELGETGLRFATLMDYVGRSRSDAVRELLIKLITYAVWQQHPEATSVRATLGTTRFPAPAAYARGAEPTVEFVASYDFARGE